MTKEWLLLSNIFSLVGYFFEIFYKNYFKII
jgi:hypothetical protein